MVVFFCTCNSEKKSKNAENVINQAFLENVKTEKVVLSNQKSELILTGKVEYDPDKIISYVPLISGIIDRTYFSLGDKVRKGQPLLDIRSTELSALQSERISLEAEEKIAERELKAAQSMFDDNMLSERELLEAKGKLRQIQAAIGKISADMSVYGTDKGNGVFTVNAPMSGYIVSKKALSGSTISPESDPAFSIADLTIVWVTVNVYASDLRFVREGMDVEITTLSYPDEVFYGKINSLSQVFDPEEKVLKARITMNNSDFKLKPEMSVLVRLVGEGFNPAFAIPSDALIFDDNRYFVVVEETAGNFVIKDVTLQGHHGKTSYIATGLTEGENVVVKNQLLIYSGLKENL
ncbi:MAG: efflux RND transporter periplasmic adaptor subunit [Bacteroidales bacterium]|nr:efflux RND transporter periplasmic adaptor subunit [Bacteroidales bacterium]